MLNLPMTTITLNLPTSFTGRVLIVLEDGELVSYSPLRNDEHITSLTAFSDLCNYAGIKPEQLLTGN
ncbi:hypothetical protein [Escherichia coli]|uniref:hypothetical protein n=1 Tax=Escherichia coli TaxID=562 RepID=UPI00135EB1AA|nr:hypothetical protein [Escherichia coli]MXF07396.1 hypothetical protein [Escherichia coli]